MRLRQVIVAQSPGVHASSASAAAHGRCEDVNTDPTKARAACLTPQVHAEVVRLGRCVGGLTSGADTLDQPLAACSRDGNTLYVLAPAAMSGNDLKHAQAVYDHSQGWLIQLAFTAKGSADFASLTRTVCTLSAPMNQVAMVVDGLVVSAPTILQEVARGDAQITSGGAGFTQAEATDLAAAVNASVLAAP